VGSLKELLDSLPQVGRLTWIGLSPRSRGEIQPVEEAQLEPGTGLQGDHHSASGRGKRQVTLIQSEHLDVIARLLGREDCAPELLRRNLVVTGINLHALKKRRFRLGTAVLEGTGDCDPCSRIEENLGAGGFNAARGHSGINAIVHEGGTIRLGDEVELLPGGTT